KLDQVLLQGVDAKCVLDGKLTLLPVPSRRRHDMPAIALQESGNRAEVIESCRRKITQYGLSIGNLHGEVVMRITPGRDLLRMAAAARPVAHKAGRGIDLRGPTRGLEVASAGREEDSDDDRGKTHG